MTFHAEDAWTSITKTLSSTPETVRLWTPTDNSLSPWEKMFRRCWKTKTRISGPIPIRLTGPIPKTSTDRVTDRLQTPTTAWSHQVVARLNRTQLCLQQLPWPIINRTGLTFSIQRNYRITSTIMAWKSEKLNCKNLSSKELFQLSSLKYWVQRT